MSKFIAPILVLAFFAAITLGLKCYDCDPTVPGQCKAPEKDNVKEIHCEDLDTSSVQKAVPRQFENGEEGDWSCVNFKFESKNETMSGIFRGCYKKENDSLSVCDKLKADESKDDGDSVQSCKECRDDLCNVGSPDGAASYTLSMTAFLGASVCFYFSNF
ncbi:uncharacterized protein LOC123003823 [Tribolium madens]|uniref:uncharacterized protein LOC123003823 n=1 Tax=Tribolium madens TaxID=41895 RepID=UPI001CF73FF4|nr:uncharacterized protein LOC123003823 [Tribolium madens]